MSGIVLNFSTPSGDGTLDGSSLVTDGSGCVTLTYTSGYQPTQVDVWDSSGYGISASGVMQVTTLAASPHSLSISADQNPLQQNQSTTVRVCLTDLVTGQPLGGQTIYFQRTGNAQLGALSATTDGEGNASIPVTAGKVASQIHAWEASSIGGAHASNCLTLSVPDRRDGYAIYLTPQSSAVCPGASTNITALVWDTNLDLPVSGVSASVGCSSGSTSVTSFTTGADGTFTFSFQGSGEPADVNVLLQSVMVSQTASIGVATHQYALSTGATASMLTPGQQTTLWAQLWDTTLDEPVANASLNFATQPGGDGSIDSGEFQMLTTDGNGCCSLTYTAGNLTTTVSVSDAEGRCIPTSYTFGVQTADPSYSLSLWANKNILLSGEEITLHAQLWDNSTGYPVSGATVSFGEVDGSGGGIVGNNYPTTDASGNCEIQFIGGSSPSTVTAIGPSLASPATYSFDVAPDTYELNVTPGVTSLAPGGSTQVYALINCTTRSGTLSGGSITANVTQGDGVIGNAGATGDYYSFTFTGGSTPSVVTVTDGLGMNLSYTITFQVAGSYALTMQPEQSLLPTGGTTKIHALLMDTGTEPPTPVPNVQIYFGTPQEPVGSGTVDDGAITSANGEAQVTYTGGTEPTTVSASASLTGSDGGSYTVIGSCRVGVSPSAVNVLEVSANTVLTAQVGTQVAVMLILKNSATQAGIAGENVTFTIDSGNGTFDSGNSSVTATTIEDGSVCVNYFFGSDPTTSVTVSTRQIVGASGGLTFTTLPPPEPCSCKYVGSAEAPCGCQDNTGCTGGCRDCTCGQSGCSCSNNLSCMGDCGPCDCSMVGSGCGCSSKSANCSGSCMQCTCGCTTCTTKSGCTNGSCTSGGDNGDQCQTTP